jgi:hypothetical protein
MAKATATTAVTGVTLELTRDEALALLAISGDIGGGSKARRVLTWNRDDGGSIPQAIEVALDLPPGSWNRAQKELGIYIDGSLYLGEVEA